MTILAAVGDGLTDDTDALNAYFDTNDYAPVPAGVFRVSKSLRVRSGHRIPMSGAATKILPVDGMTEPVFDVSNVSDVFLGHAQLIIPESPGKTGIQIFQSKNVQLEDILFHGGGGYPVVLASSEHCDVDRVVIRGGYSNTGIQVNDCRFVNIKNHKIFAENKGFYGIQVARGRDVTVENGFVEKTPDEYFGIHAWGSHFAKVKGNRVENTRREAIAVGHGCVGVELNGNYCTWSENLGVGDFGISLAGDNEANVVADFIIQGNTIVNSAFDGIGVAGFAQRGRIEGNNILNCCWGNKIGFNAGVKLYGYIPGAFTQNITVSKNNITRSASPGLIYSVFEKPELGSVGYNKMGQNDVFNLTTNHIFKSASSSVILN